MVKKAERDYLERCYLENPFVWDAQKTQEISTLLGMTRKKVTQWRYVRSRKDPQFMDHIAQKRARKERLVQTSVGYTLRGVGMADSFVRQDAMVSGV